jgi:hypothetical protein
MHLLYGRYSIAAHPHCKDGFAGRSPRKWWYRSLEKQEEIDLAFRWTLSLPGVVAGFPPSFLDLQDKAIEAGLAYRPATEADARKLKEMAQGTGSIFKREQDSVAFHSPYPHNPGEWT